MKKYLLPLLFLVACQVDPTPEPPTPTTDFDWWDYIVDFDFDVHEIWTGEITVFDGDGEPVPFAPFQLITKGEVIMESHTTMDGTANIHFDHYPSMDLQCKYVYGSVTHEASIINDGFDIEFYMNEDVIYGTTDSDLDGIPDHADTHPINPHMSSTYLSKGKWLVEDLYPWKGDYDYNDVVIGYEWLVYYDELMRPIKVDADFMLEAVGGTLDNGFAIRVDSLMYAQIMNYELSESKSDFVNDLGRAYFVINFEVADEMGNMRNVLNHTAPIDTQSLSFEIMGGEAGDKFYGKRIDPMIINNRVAYTWNEIHLKGRKPSRFFDSDYLDKGDDITLRSGYAQTYCDTNGMPWMLHTDPMVTQVVEYENFKNAYYYFKQWYVDQGLFNRDWHKYCDSTLIWK